MSIAVIATDGLTLGVRGAPGSICPVCGAANMGNLNCPRCLVEHAEFCPAEPCAVKVILGQLQEAKHAGGAAPP